MKDRKIELNQIKTIIESKYPDIKILWIGRPKSGIIFRSADLFLIPMSMIIVSTVLYISSILIYKTAYSVMVMLFVGIINLFLIALLFGRFLVDNQYRTNVIYVFGGSKIGFYKLSKQEVKWYNIPRWENISIEFDSKTNCTHIFFGKKDPMSQIGPGMKWWPSSWKTPTFEFITDSEALQKMLKNLS